MLRVIGVLIGLSGLYFVMNRDFYLPFLGPTVIGRVNQTQTTTTNPKITVQLDNLPANKNIIYWASGPKKDGVFETPMEAYQSSMSGFVQSNENGLAVIQIECPSAYMIPKFGIFKRTLKSHVHYRYELEIPGVYSKVFTKYVDC